MLCAYWKQVARYPVSVREDTLHEHQYFSAFVHNDERTRSEKDIGAEKMDVTRQTGDAGEHHELDPQPPCALRGRDGLNVAIVTKREHVPYNCG